MTYLFLMLGFLISPAQNAPDLPQAPDFTLMDIDNNRVSLNGFKGKYVVLEWTNMDCPFVQAHLKAGDIQKHQTTYMSKGVIWLSINSSASGKQGNLTSDEWKKRKAQHHLKPNHTLLDPDGNVGKLYGAKTTPHIFIINPTGQIIYQGAIDDNSSVNVASIKDAKNYVDTVLDAALSDKEIPISKTDPYGCSVKY